ncbi:MAG: acyl--CoA ligase, partial [Acidimicrobiia bacterium]|nr:acyl--CoA ligase [Acidimicrobiia bacterium]
MPVAPVYRDDPRLDVLIGAGGPFEVTDVVVDGVPLRDFVRAPRTVVDVFAMGAAHEALVAVVHGDERWTFADVRRRSLSLARELHTTLGVAPGDRVAIAMRNLPEFVVSFWGAVLAGAVFVPLNAWWTGEELAYAISDAGASVVAADDERLDRIVGHGRPDGIPLIGVRSDRGDVAFDDLTGGDPIPDAEIPALDRDDPITLLYTSGTTGRPTGALITNRSMTANLWNMAFASTRNAIVDQRPPRPPRQSASLSTGPLFHIGGISAIVGGQMGGSKMVLMPRWDLDEALRLAREEDLTALGGVPAVARQIL